MWIKRYICTKMVETCKNPCKIFFILEENNGFVKGKYKILQIKTKKTEQKVCELWKRLRISDEMAGAQTSARARAHVWVLQSFG